jgi:manganese efflux pump family protein
MSWTSFVSFILLGVGLSFDSFAVAVSCGVMKQEIRFQQAIPIALSLAFFQALFPLLGWFAGTTLHHWMEFLDHWIAFVLLALVGIKMIAEGIRSKGKPWYFDPFRKRIIISLSVATSIDALVVGLSFGFLNMPILFPVIIIGVITFVASMLGMLFGKNISPGFTRESFILGGVILLGMGIKILADHLS